MSPNKPDSDVSPTPEKKPESKVKGMFFSTALIKVLEGKKISRPEWAKDEYGYLGKDEILYVHRDGKDYQWLLHRIDMEATDYIIAPIN